MKTKRKITEAEKKRLKRFQEKAAALKAEGYAQTEYTKGESKLAELMDKLFSAGRVDDARKAVKDENFRAGLFKEFHIL